MTAYIVEIGACYSGQSSVLYVTAIGKGASAKLHVRRWQHLRCKCLSFWMRRTAFFVALSTQRYSSIGMGWLQCEKISCKPSLVSAAQVLGSRPRPYEHHACVGGHVLAGRNFAQVQVLPHQSSRQCWPHAPTQLLHNRPDEEPRLLTRLQRCHQ